MKTAPSDNLVDIDIFDRASAVEIASTLKAVADPTRLQLLALIASRPDREACVCDLTEDVDLSQPTVSHHLKVLVDSGLLRKEQRQTWSWFSLDEKRWDELRAFLRIAELPVRPQSTC